MTLFYFTQNLMMEDTISLWNNIQDTISLWNNVHGQYFICYFVWRTLFHGGCYFMLHVPCYLYVGELFCSFKKECAHFSCYKRLYFLSLPNTTYFPVAFQSCCPILPSFMCILNTFLYIVELILVLNMREIYLPQDIAQLKLNQSLPLIMWYNLLSRIWRIG